MLISFEREVQLQPVAGCPQACQFLVLLQGLDGEQAPLGVDSEFLDLHVLLIGSLPGGDELAPSAQDAEAPQLAFLGQEHVG